MSALEDLIVQKRLELAGKPGIRGLIANGRTFSLAIFASLGGLVYGYNQGMFGQVLNMTSFENRIGANQIVNPVTRGLLTAILELGAWIGVLSSGYLADKLGRRWNMVLASGIFTIGIVIQSCARNANPNFTYGGRFVAGLGVGGFSINVPLYVSIEIRGSLVSFYQFSIAAGTFVSYWITYGTDFIYGSDGVQSNAAWLIPTTIQLVPALLLAVGMLFVPQSPRWLMHQGREEECLSVVSRLRHLPSDHLLVRLEFLEIKVQNVFEQRISQRDFPQYQDGSRKSNFMLVLYSYLSLVTNPRNRKRSMIAVLIMTFQQWTGINFVIYYAPFIFNDLQLGGTTTSLLSSGVVGIVEMLATIPAVLYLDQMGRRPALISGAISMGVCMFVVAGIIGQCQSDWPAHKDAGWVAAVFIWLFVGCFSYSWGPGAWTIISEIFPLSLRAKGLALGASSNWMNNFAVGISTPDFVATATFGTYVFLGMICVLGAVYVYYFLPETKGQSLEEINRLFGDQSEDSKIESEMQISIARELGLLALAGIETDDPEKIREHHLKT